MYAKESICKVRQDPARVHDGAHRISFSVKNSHICAVRASICCTLHNINSEVIETNVTSHSVCATSSGRSVLHFSSNAV